MLTGGATVMNHWTMVYQIRIVTCICHKNVFTNVIAFLKKKIAIPKRHEWVDYTFSVQLIATSRKFKACSKSSVTFVNVPPSVCSSAVWHSWNKRGNNGAFFHQSSSCNPTSSMRSQFHGINLDLKSCLVDLIRAGKSKDLWNVKVLHWFLTNPTLKQQKYVSRLNFKLTRWN